jgi:hypothetical protein
MSKSANGGSRGFSDSNRHVVPGAGPVISVMKSNSTNQTMATAKARQVRFRSLILAAAVLHISVTGAVFAVGKLRLMPSQFDPHGIAAFASDGYIYQGEATELCDVLKNQGVRAWATWPTQLHVRLYSLPLAIVSRWTSFNVLTIEPLNLIYYLFILVLVFKLGETIFDYRTGMLAAAIVAVWPTFLLHTTQLLRDPLLISVFLILMLSLTRSLKRDYAWQRGLLWGLVGALAIVIIRIVRLPMWDLIYAIVALGVLFLAVRCIRERRVPIGNVAFAAILIGAMLITPRLQWIFRDQTHVTTPRVVVPEKVQTLPLPNQIAVRRQAFDLRLDEEGNAVKSDAGSKLDAEVKFQSAGDIVRHVPRAVVVGFFAPFPNMWLSVGKQVGSGGRLLSGFESLLTYVIECLALFGLWFSRKQLTAWLVFLAVLLGATALGLVVTNIGALYRLRYPFWSLLVIFGAGGVVYFLDRKLVTGRSKFSSRSEKSTEPGNYSS